jgi:hypothetical protein
MIKIESAHIEQVRGIRNLDLNFKKETFSISGPNGSGKSGVIDAIEFGLTGNIGRLTGRGTKGLSVAEHGPHVDKTKFPDAAFVELKVFLTNIGKSATITRKVKAPKKPKIEPADPDIMAALAEIADHPEITLSRRDIVRFILIESTKRSEEIQSLLKLDDIGQARSALNSAQNKLKTMRSATDAQLQSARTNLARHLQTDTVNSADILESVNSRRKVLDLAEIEKLTASTKLDEGLSAAAKIPEFNKASALRDLKAFSDAEKNLPLLARAEVSAIIADLSRLETDSTLLSALQRRSFIEKGFDLVDGPDCPLCDTAWESEKALRGHIKVKLEKSEEARKIQESLLANGALVAAKIISILGLLVPVQRLSQEQQEDAITQILILWKTEIDAVKSGMATVDGIAALKSRLETDWLAPPKDLAASVKFFTAKMDAKPDQTATLDARTFLTTAQIRFDDYLKARRKDKTAGDASNFAKTAYDLYCEVFEEELNTLYGEVEADFSKFYRFINGDDEAKFTAKLTPSEGTLELDVNFYERGLFPPGAYHSEGHQDGMGVCLYLALMKRLFDDQFTFALLDDVVMSVDSDHRYQFCKLLKTSFPNTQFIITTHDRLWAEQMKSAGLVTGKTSVVFQSWSIDGGPVVETHQEIWLEIDALLAKGKVEAAAMVLRHHLEYVSRHLAGELGATTTFKSDGNYELGELLPSVLKRMKDLYGKAAKSAQSWGNNEAKEEILKRKATLSTCNTAMSIDQWAVNKAVHYNAWANFGKTDFKPVVAAAKELLECFTCESCKAWVYTTPRGTPESVRCGCNATNLNLKVKPTVMGA